MGKRILIVAVLVATAFAGVNYVWKNYYTRSFSPFETVRYEGNGLRARVEYCRPQKKGRAIFGELVPYGEVWRTGANDATRLTIDTPIRFGGKRVAAGTYSVFTIPEEGTWTIILNNEAKQWGAFDYDKAQDAARTEVRALNSDTEVEQFTIDFQESGDGVELWFKWDRTRAAVELAPIEDTAS